MKIRLISGLYSSRFNQEIISLDTLALLQQVIQHKFRKQFVGILQSPGITPPCWRFEHFEELSTVSLNERFVSLCL